MSDTIKILWTIVFVSVAVYLGVIISYASNFGLAWSNNPNDWAALGDFLGGVLGPFLSFMALIALLVTIVLQNKELENTRLELTRTADVAEKQFNYIASQQQRDDLYRLVSNLTENIKRTCEQKCLPRDYSIHDALVGHSNVFLNEALEMLDSEMKSPISSAFNNMKIIERDLNSLVLILSDFELVSSSVSKYLSPIKGFYLKEHSSMVKEFCKRGWFDNELLKHYAV
jgi:hypothetical protein